MSHSTTSQCLKITEKDPFTIAFKQCYQAGQFQYYKNWWKMLKFERDIFENYQTQCFVHQLLKACKYFDNESHHGVLLLLPPTMYPNAHTKSTCALGSSGNGGGTLHFYCCSVSANIQESSTTVGMTLNMK